MECSTTVVINKPIEHVWDYVNTPENLPLWLNDFVRYEHLTGDPNVPAVGDRSNHTYLQNGKEFTMQEEITEINPPHSIKLLMTSSWFDMEIINTFETIGNNRTRLFAGAKSTRLNWMMKIFMFFGSNDKQQKLHEEQINKLKSLIEAVPGEADNVNANQNEDSLAT